MFCEQQFFFSAPGKNQKGQYSLLYTDYSILRFDVNFYMGYCALFFNIWGRFALAVSNWV